MTTTDTTHVRTSDTTTAAPPQGIDLDALRRAIEERDATAQIAFYAADARLVVIDRLHPPTRPQVLAGRAEIATWIADIAARDMTHRVTTAIADHEQVALTEACAYPDGTAVLCACFAQLRAGLITSQQVVQVWDE